VPTPVPTRRDWRGAPRYPRFCSPSVTLVTPVTSMRASRCIHRSPPSLWTRGTFAGGCGNMGGSALSTAPEETDMAHRRTDGSRAESPAIRLLDALRNGDDAGVLA